MVQSKEKPRTGTQRLVAKRASRYVHTCVCTSSRAPAAKVLVLRSKAELEEAVGLVDYEEDRKETSRLQSGCQLSLERNCLQAGLSTVDHLL